MNAEDTLSDLYREWRRLAELEGDAIRARDWSLLADCEKSLRALQPKILRQHEAAPKSACHATIAELIELARHNLELLEQCRRAASLQRTRLYQTRANLQRIQRSYASTPQAAWVSFS